ncbi:MAG: hypothetical protein H4O13_04840 [Xanthomonadales bacterium]|nr:hypothetical protein [Xanthomonadales bacterium]
MHGTPITFVSPFEGAKFRYAEGFAYAVPEHLAPVLGLKWLDRRRAGATVKVLVDTGQPEVTDGCIFYDHAAGYELHWGEALKSLRTILQVSSGSPSSGAYGGGTVVFRVMDIVTGQVRQRLEAPRELTQVQFREVLKLGLSAMGSIELSEAAS